MNLDELLGIDPTDPVQQHADAIVRAHDGLLEDLRAHRAIHGPTTAQVAERMGVSVTQVREIEGYQGIDMGLSTLRRYCLAIGASVSFTVAPFVTDAQRTADPLAARYAHGYQED